MWSKILVLAECYANHFIAQKIFELLASRVDRIKPSIKHKRFYGRDRIVKEATEIVSRSKNTLLVLIIDYERGVSRAFIDSFFEIKEARKIRAPYNVKLGARRKGSSNVLALVFDPNIEEALLCKLDKSLCRDENLRRIKSRKAYNILDNALRSRQALELVRLLAEEIRDFILEARSRDPALRG